MLRHPLAIALVASMLVTMIPTAHADPVRCTPAPDNALSLECKVRIPCMEDESERLSPSEALDDDGLACAAGYVYGGYCGELPDAASEGGHTAIESVGWNKAPYGASLHKGADAGACALPDEA